MAAPAGPPTGAILLVVLLLFRPVLSLERDELARRGLVLLLDTSASMSTADDATGATRFDQARSRVLDWSARLKNEFDLHVRGVLGAGRRAGAAGRALASSSRRARRPR